MRKVFALCLTGASLGLVLGCGAGKDPEKRSGVRLDEGGTAGTEGASGSPATGGAGGAAGSAGANSAGARPEGGSAGAAGGSAVVPVGEGCLQDDECGSMGICYEGPVSSGRTCRVPCDVEDAGLRGACAANELCVRASSGSLAACLGSCDPEVEPSGCADGDSCLADPPPSFTGGTPVAGLCVVEGAQGIGDGNACDSGSCPSGLVCYDAALPTVGTPHCALPCDPRATGACEEGDVCRRLTPTSGACLRICDPYSTNTCPTGEWCFPFHEALSDGTTLIEGHCVRPGILGEGEPCTGGACGEGMICAEPSTAYPQVGPSCRPLCALADSDSCDVGVCGLVAGTALELAACQPDCELLVEGAEAGCDDGQWCAPTATLGANVCVVSGSIAAGEACQSSGECVSGHYCDCRFGSDSDCSGDGRCESICDPQQADACADGATCVPEVWAGIVMPFGVCRESCDSAAADCTDGEETCVAAAFIGAATDACLDVPSDILSGQPCGQTDVALNEPCQSSALCVTSERTGEAECIDVCRPEVAAYETTEHPDCSDPLAACRQISADGAYGYCW